jgi:hypothetical protein
MGVGAVVGAVATVGSAVIGGKMQSDAAKDAARAGQDSAAAELAFYRESRDIDAANNKPFLDTGYNALNALNSMTGLQKVEMPEGYSNSGKPYKWQKDPGYMFRMAEGSDALDSRLAAGGGFLSGASIKAATQYNQNFATNEFSNVFNRLSTLAGYGPTAAAASNNPNYTIGGGNAIGASGYYGASGQIAQGNAWANTANQIGQGVGNWMGGGGQTPAPTTGAGWSSTDFSSFGPLVSK